jgi:hypothetical protein
MFIQHHGSSQVKQPAISAPSYSLSVDRNVFSFDYLPVLCYPASGVCTITATGGMNWSATLNSNAFTLNGTRGPTTVNGSGNGLFTIGAYGKNSIAEGTITITSLAPTVTVFADRYCMAAG